MGFLILTAKLRADKKAQRKFKLEQTTGALRNAVILFAVPKFYKSRDDNSTYAVPCSMSFLLECITIAMHQTTAPGNGGLNFMFVDTRNHGDMDAGEIVRLWMRLRQKWIEGGSKPIFPSESDKAWYEIGDGRYSPQFLRK